MNDLLVALEENPNDWVRWLIFADYLEENGHPVSKCFRWCGENKKVPAWDLGGWWWHSIGEDDEFDEVTMSYRLPKGIFWNMKTEKKRKSDCVKFSHLYFAVEALLGALP